MIKAPSVSSLQVGKMLFLNILSEIRHLMDDFAPVNGRYVAGVEKVERGWIILKRREVALASDLLLSSCSVSEVEADTGKKEANKLRKFGRSVVQSSKNLRTIALEPKRLVGATTDTEKFEDLIAKLANFNDFLISLLDGSQMRRVHEVTTAGYLEILQLRNDVKDLERLVIALSDG
jgi:hypothetical protein